MFTIILETKTEERLAKVSHLLNEKYLLQTDHHYKILSELSNVDYDVFGREDMEQLISELQQLKKDLDKESVKHIDEIIQLAIRCKDTPDCYLVFTPF